MRIVPPSFSNLCAGFLLSSLMAGPLRAANLTTTEVQPGGTDWTVAIWKTNGLGTAVSPVAGNTYECIPNGIPFGLNKSNTRIRNPTSAPVVTFPGDSLTLNTNTELRIKQGSGGPLLNFPGVGIDPGLVLNGGVLNVGDDRVFVITGRVQVASASFICPADVGGGAVKPLRGVNIAGQLSGTGTMVVFQAGTTVAQEVSGSFNTFSGKWILKAGWLLASGLNSLGTNNIIVDPDYALNLDPSIDAVAGPALFEPGYDVNSAGTLTLAHGGVMNLHQNCAFAAVTIQGTPLSSGTHPYSELVVSFPNNFGVGGSGSLTVQPYGPPPPSPPSFVIQPASAELYQGNSTQMVAYASGSGSLTYRWQKGTNGVFVYFNDNGSLLGSRSNILSFSPAGLADSADYRLIAVNSVGAATSQVATLTVLLTDLGNPIVAGLNPPAGSALNSFSQLEVTFSERVVGVAAADLLVNGIPANSVSGSGMNYVFTFNQPHPGTVTLYWDSDNGITDLDGNPLNPGSSWAYTLADNLPPALASTAPADGATVSRVALAEVFFSEPVTGVEASDLLVGGLPATNVSGAGIGPYLFSFSPAAPGSVLFSWAAGNNIRDLVGNVFDRSGWNVTVNPATAAAATNVVINEFLASNVGANGLADEDGELSDWIEICNHGPVSVNLAGWSLSDNASQPDKWVFPAVTLGPGQYRVIFASGKDRRVPGANLHTNFKLGVGGDYLGLFNSEYPPHVVHEYAPEYPEQRSDISYGLDDTGNRRYFQVPTPGGPNGSSTITGVVAEVHFSVQRGFFGQPFKLHLSTRTPGALIAYTSDGSDPATAGTLYNEPLTINRTTVLRAAAFASSLLPSAVKSRTYLFVEDIVHQPNNPPGYPTGNVWTPTPEIVKNGSRAYYQMDPVIVEDPQYAQTARTGLVSIPSMSIISPIDGLFGPVNGIYSHPMNRGPGWERPCSMELIFPDGADGLQVDCGIQIQGGTQRDPAKNAKHSFRVNFKSEYGSARLNFPMFSDSPLESYNTLVLDGGINMWWHYVGGSSPADQRYRAQCVRDQYASDLALALGIPACRGQFYHLYLNGLYWGLHYIHERPDEDFAADYLGGSSADYDVLRHTTVGLEVLAGDTDAWNAALALSDSGLANNAQYLQLLQYVDIDNLIDYMIVNHWIGNEDWPWHNWYVIRKRVPGAGFKFIVWDAEHVLKTTAVNRTGVADSGTPAQIYDALRNNAEFRLRFADHLQKHFFNGGLFYTDPDPVRALWDPAHPERNIPAAYYMRRIREIDTAIVDESARWGGYTLTTNYTRNNHWLRELNNLLGFTNNAGNTANFFPTRSATVLSQYRSKGLFPNVSAPEFSQYGGNVPVGFALTMTNPNSGGTVYYTTNGTDPRVYSSGAVTLGAVAYTAGSPLLIGNSMTVKARVLNGSWSALTEASFSAGLLGVPVRITEIMYHPVGGSAYEYIELQNIGSTTVDLSGCRFDQVTCVFPEGTLLAPGAVMVIGSADDPIAFAARYPGVVVSATFTGSLDNSGERLALLDRNGNTIISVDYEDSGGWPVAADGPGYSLEILDPNGDPDDPANWRASTALNGSPGVVNAGPTFPTVRFNEVMADNAGAIPNGGSYPDWLELYNTGSAPVPLGNWSLSNSGNSRKYVFPSSVSIPAQGYLLVWCDTDTNAPGLHAGFTLGRKGESLFLYDAQTNRVDAFSFGLQIANYSVGRIGSAASWQLTVPTPGSNNVATATGSATNLVLNEWLANTAPGASDWLELYNSALLPVPLQGIYLATTNDIFQVRSLSFIPPGGFAQFFADRQPGPDHLDFKLSAAGEQVTLYDSAGVAADQVSFDSQIENVSQGRLPNGGPSIVSFPGSSSPGASNYVNAYTGPVLNELMARNAAAVYDSRGHNPDWLELYNPNAAAFSLAGMGLSTDQLRPRWTFPAGTSIAGNGYLLVWCDSSAPASTNLTSDLNTGFALNANGEGVYVFNTNAQAVDGVTFGFQVADLSIGRSGGTWTLLSFPTPRTANATPAQLGSSANLRINEWMANPVSGDNWFELYNTGNLPVALAGLHLTDDPSVVGMTKFQVGPLNFIGPRGWIEFQADGHPSHGPDHVSFSLDGDGDSLRLYDSTLALIDAVDFGLQDAGVSRGRLPDGASTIISFPTTPTPSESNYLPLPTIVVNEVLPHTDPPFEDAIELYNSGPSDIWVGGWFISNSQSDFKKYRIPVGTILRARSYLVFYEYQFNSTNAVPFTLNSAHGDSVFLSQADAAGNLTGYRAQISFGAAENGVSFGRFLTSQGVDFVPMSRHTFGVDNPANLTQFRSGGGLTNAEPKIGPVVINEIMYHPVTPIGTNVTENPDEEFVELLNATAGTVPLYDPAALENRWKIGGGIEFVFPPGIVLAPGGFAVVVGFDPMGDPAALANFRAKYGLGTGVAVYGPYAGRLENQGETISLFKPDTPQTAPHPDAGFVPYVLVDSINYSNALPWPAEANGTGQSLQRRSPLACGNEPLNWLACDPTPGASNCGMDSDSDGDGLPNDWEIANGLNPNSDAGDDGANGDPDHDGFTNLQEYLAGTNPRDPLSYLKFDSIDPVPGGVALHFTAVASHSYSIQFRENLASGAWQRLADFDPPASTTQILTNDLPGAGHATRFYRLVTPRIP